MGRQIRAAIWLNWVTGAAAGAAFFALILLYRTEIDTRTQAQAALTAAQTAQEELELSERPWVSIEPTISEPLTFRSDGGAEISFTERLENFGQGVAKAVFPMQEILPMGLTNFEPILAERDRMCDAVRLVKVPKRASGYVLFPKQALVIPPESSFLTKKQISDAYNFVPHSGCPNDAKMIELVVVGCALYTVPFEPKTAPEHITKFMYLLGKPDKERGGVSFLCASGSPPGLELVNWPWGFDAD